jgi:trehalose 6-phosphate phosphatase
MKHALGPDGKAAIARLLRFPALLAFDFDGTLAPYVTHPDAAAMRSTTRELLATVATRAQCAVISARSRADVMERLQNVSLVDVIGNYGVEPHHVSDEYVQVIADTHSALRQMMDGLRGVRIEDKRYSLHLHYSASPAKAVIREVVGEFIQRRQGLRAFSSDRGIGVFPAAAPDKGIAFHELLKRCGLQQGLYVGDDDADEAVFRAVLGGEGLTIRVGFSASSHARFFLDHQDQMDELLALLGASVVERDDFP